jgi:branched-chain amino acid transport system substrate-binding protein
MTHVRTCSVLSMLLLAATATACSDDGTASREGTTPTVAEAPAERLQVALVASLTGPGSSIGNEAQRGAQLAIEQINARGGLLGRQLELRTLDDEGVPEIAAAKLAEAASSGVVLGVGPTSNATSKAVLPLVRSGKVLVVSPSATGTDLDCVETGADDDETKRLCAAKRAWFDETGDAGAVLFRTTPSDSFLATAIAQYASEAISGSRRCRSIAIVRQEDGYGQQVAERLANRYKQLNLAVRRTVTIDPTLASIFQVQGAVATLATSPVPDCQVVIAEPRVAAGYMKVFKEWYGANAGALPVDFQTIGSDGFRNDALLSKDAATAEGSVAIAPDTAPVSAEFDAFRALHAARFPNASPGRFAATAYDAVMVLAGAVSRAGSATNVADVRKALFEVAGGRSPKSSTDLAGFLRAAAAGEDIDYRGASGAVDFDLRTGGVSSDFAAWRIKGAAFVREATYEASVLSGD